MPNVADNLDEDLTTVLQFHEKFVREHFYGEVKQIWQDGKIVVMKIETTVKPKDFIRVDVRIMP